MAVEIKSGDEYSVSDEKSSIVNIFEPDASDKYLNETDFLLERVLEDNAILNDLKKREPLLRSELEIYKR